MYVTAARFRTMNLGTDVSGYTDLQIASSIERASRIAEAVVAVSNVPQRHSFLGGTITDERQRWKYPMTPFELGQRRVYPFHTPLVLNDDGTPAITKFRIYVTNTQYVGIDASDLVYQSAERYVEVVSLALTSAGLFNALIIPNVGLATPFVVMDYTYGQVIPMTDDIAYPISTTVYQASNQFWTTTAPVVKVAGVTLSAGYTSDPIEGTITFNTAPVGTVTVTYETKLTPEIPQAVALIAAYDMGESKLRGKGMSGLDTLAAGEIRLSRTQRDRVTADNLESLVPDAYALLTSLKLGRASV